MAGHGAKVLRCTSHLSDASTVLPGGEIESRLSRGRLRRSRCYTPRMSEPKLRTFGTWAGVGVKQPEGGGGGGRWRGGSDTQNGACVMLPQWWGGRDSRERARRTGVQKHACNLNCTVLPKQEWEGHRMPNAAETINFRFDYESVICIFQRKSC